MAPHAGVVGSPVDHSLSPLLHGAAYHALGLTGWSYHRAEVPAGALADHVATLDETWRGLSVTMPGKEEALALAATAGAEALAVGAANTLLRTAGGWHAENTDVSGLEAALREAGADRVTDRVDVIGSGATARAALLALHRLGARRVRLVVRRDVRPATAALAARLDLELADVRYDAWPAHAPSLVLSTVPADGAPPVDPGRRWDGALVLDVVYAPWPTPLAAAVRAAGGRAVGGGSMLLHQAAAQVALMTGRPAPLAAMRAALATRLPEVAG